MASSSSSLDDWSRSKRFKYDVFISFRGEDTRKNFVDQLYAALQQKSIYTFKDDEERKEMDDELIKAIEDSKIFIIVFSKNYASSSWCLDELVKIMECQKTKEQIAYPVFYDVEPSEVRKQIGSVGEAFTKHEKKNSAGKWRDALKEAADLAGWELNNTDGHVGKLIKAIVQLISLELRSIKVNFDESLVGMEHESLVGMEHRLQAIESVLEIGLNDVRMIGIKGMGGSGKTTLARAIFNKFSRQFERVSFVENIKEVSKESGLEVLQGKVMKCHGIINSVDDGKRWMKRILRYEKFLLVLDDVDHRDQLEALAGGTDWFKAGSRIIITTRDEQVLIAHGVKHIHDVSLLTEKESICLFSRYAFGREIPIQGYEEKSLRVVHCANGLPLTIKVWGSFLYGKNNLEWIEALERLNTLPLKRTLEKLELSYLSLDDNYKEIFLDAACLLKGWKKDRAITLLESSGFHAKPGLSVLQHKSLITIDDDQVLGVHYQIEQMGKAIVRHMHPDDPSRHSRLWILEEIEDVLANERGTNATTICIVLDTPVTLSSGIVTIGFGGMKNLRAVHLVSEISNDCDVKFDQVPLTFPNALRFLSWEGYPHCSLPQTFQANNLVTLEMSYSRIEQLWEGGERKVLNKLRFLDLRFSRLTSLDVGLTPNLEKLDLEDCYHLEEFLTPTGCLKRLVYLNLSGCKRMKSFLFIKQLESLEVLCLSRLLLKEFPDIIPGHHHSSLLELQFSYNNIEQFPGIIGRLECLENLKLSSTLKFLPDSICKLKRLKTLHLSSCWNLERLPQDLDQLKCLENLILKECRQISDIPYIGTERLSEGGKRKVLKKLKILHLSHLKLERLHLGLAPNLEVLFIEECHDLVGLYIPDECLKLRNLDLSHSKLKILDLTRTENLEVLKIKECHDLVKIHMPFMFLTLRSFDLTHSKLSTLKLCETLEIENLSIKECYDLVKFQMPNGQKLRSFDITHSKLRTLEFYETPNLEKLSLDECHDLVELLMPFECPKLTSLELSHSKLGTLNLGVTPNLERLDLEDCYHLEELHMPVECLKRLVYLNLSGCSGIESFTFIKQLESLEVLCLTRLYLKEFPDIIPVKGNNSLRKLSFRYNDIEELPSSIANLDKLVYLDLHSCRKLRSLPKSICGLRHLKTLKLYGCILQELPEDIDQLELLEKLNLSFTRIKQLPHSICGLKHLKTLNLSSCWNLEKLPEGLGRLECLENLILTECTQVRDIPDSICQMNHLKYLSVLGCIQLKELPEELGLLKCLEVLNLKGTQIRHLPQSISLLKGLEIYGPKSGLRILGDSSIKKQKIGPSNLPPEELNE